MGLSLRDTADLGILCRYHTKFFLYPCYCQATQADRSGNLGSHNSLQSGWHDLSSVAISYCNIFMIDYTLYLSSNAPWSWSCFYRGTIYNTHKVYTHMDSTHTRRVYIHGDYIHTRSQEKVERKIQTWNWELFWCIATKFIIFTYVTIFKAQQLFFSSLYDIAWTSIALETKNSKKDIDKSDKEEEGSNDEEDDLVE